MLGFRKSKWRKPWRHIFQRFQPTPCKTPHQGFWKSVWVHSLCIRWYCNSGVCGILVWNRLIASLARSQGVFWGNAHTNLHHGHRWPRILTFSYIHPTPNRGCTGRCPPLRDGYPYLQLLKQRISQQQIWDCPFWLYLRDALNTSLQGSTRNMHLGLRIHLWNSCDPLPCTRTHVCR